MSTYSSASRSKQKSTSVRSNAGVVTVARKYSGQRSESVTVFDKARIKELEQQVSDLKKRLDELRKAKNTTIVRKDKEYVAVGASHFSQVKTKCDHLDYCKEKNYFLQTELENQEHQTKNQVQGYENDIASLKEMHKAEIEELKQQLESQVKLHDRTRNDHFDLLNKTKEQNMTLKEENEKLKSKVVDLQLRIDDLMDELSKKEAEWCSKEENLVLELKTSWGVKYQQWMAQTEAKIEELQSANNFLTALLEKENPDKE